MSYAEAVQFVRSRLKFGSRPGLANMERIASLCGSPQRGMRFLHVAGTNGKGSVCAMLSRMLTAAGYKTGLYISPYVIDFRERFQIDGVMISKPDFAALMARLRPMVDRLDGEGCYLTEFELITAAAFLYFREQNCDYVVLEVGLGGRFDATNIIERPVCSVLTHIDLDHTKLLGDTYAAIAYEKCGILKSGCPAVVYPDQHPESLAVIRRVAGERGCPLTVPPVPKAEIGLFGSVLHWNGMTLDLPLIGAHQVKNAAVALAVASRLGLDGEAVRTGLQKAFMPARLEILSRDPLVLLDGAHNPDGVTALTNALRDLCDKKPTLVLGMLADKDYERSLSILAPLCAHIITLSVPNPRTLTACKLAKCARRFCPDVTPCRSYRAALQLAGEKAQGDPVVVAGSLFLASGIRPRLLQWVKTLPVSTA